MNSTCIASECERPAFALRCLRTTDDQLGLILPLCERHNLQLLEHIDALQGVHLADGGVCAAEVVAIEWQRKGAQ